MKREQFEIAGRTVTLQLPEDPERLLNNAATAGDDSDPYWGILWDAAIDTARCVLRSDWPQPQRVLEIGCGCGLVGVAGLLAGLDVTFSDLVPAAVELAVSNAAINGFAAATGYPIDWRDETTETFDTLLASDVLYDASHHDALLRFAGEALKADGCLWIGDPGRQQAEAFIRLAEQQGWSVEIRDRERLLLSQPVLARFQLLICRKPIAEIG